MCRYVTQLSWQCHPFLENTVYLCSKIYLMACLGHWHDVTLSLQLPRSTDLDTCHPASVADKCTCTGCQPPMPRRHSHRSYRTRALQIIQTTAGTKTNTLEYDSIRNVVRELTSSVELDIFTHRRSFELDSIRPTRCMSVAWMLPFRSQGNTWRHRFLCRRRTHCLCIRSGHL